MPSTVDTEGETLPSLVVNWDHIPDRYKGQCTSDVLSALNDGNINLAIVSANCTDHLQPLDVSVNKAAKEFL